MLSWIYVDLVYNLDMNIFIFMTQSIVFNMRVERSNVCNLMCILKCFEEMSGLRVNLSKSKLYGVEVQAREVRRLARGLKCCVGETPFLYLGLPVGDSMRRVDQLMLGISLLRNSRRGCVIGKRNWCLMVVVWPWLNRSLVVYPCIIFPCSGCLWAF